mmetsp:Transcript_30398/g.35049  ORF Transcript_30398/g.35049 Transcript_30398/m.35049 type:complete len:138 (+) Transcript_30398:96-509(+)
MLLLYKQQAAEKREQRSKEDYVQCVALEVLRALAAHTNALWGNEKTPGLIRCDAVGAACFELSDTMLLFPSSETRKSEESITICRLELLSILFLDIERESSTRLTQEKIDLLNKNTSFPKRHCNLHQVQYFFVGCRL